MQTNSWKLDGQPARQLHAPLDGVDHLRHGGMARVEGRVGVDDADNGPRQGIVAVAEGLDEDLAEEEGEVRVAVRGEALAEAGGILRDGGVEVVV